MSLIILDLWESFSYEGKSSWIIDAYGFIGPSIYFFILSNLKDSFKFKNIFYLLFLPGLLEILIQVIRIFDFRIIGSNYFSDGQFAFALEFLEIIAFVLCFILFLLLIKPLQEAYTKKRSLLSKKLVAFIIINTLIISIWGIFLVGEFSLQSVATISLISVVPIGIILLLSEHIRNPDLSVKPQQFSKRKLKVKENQRAQSDMDKIIVFLNKEKSFKNPDFNLKQLSNDMRIPKDYISELINHQLGKTFKMYLNELRIAEAILLFQDKNYDHFSILGIALEVGLNQNPIFIASLKIQPI